MSPTVEQTSHKRRVSFSHPFQLSLSTKEKEPKSNEHRPKETHGAKFYVMHISGLGPTSIQRQYRVVIKSGEHKIVTPWGSPGKNGFSMNESISMHLFEISPVTFTVERRHRLGRPVTVAESATSNLSDLMSRQQIESAKPLIIELKMGAQSVTIEVRVQTYNIVPGIKVDDQRPKAIYGNYPATALSVSEVLGKLLPKLKRTQQMAYLMLYIFLREMNGYMAEHPREISSFDVEDIIWRFLRESARYLQNVSDSKSKRIPEGDFSPANIIFRGFSVVFQLHRPQGSDLDAKERNILLNQLDLLLKALLNETPQVANFLSLSSEYNVLQELQGAKMTPPRLQEQDSENFLTKKDSTLHDICRWMVNPEAEQQVLWLPSKNDSEIKNQVTTMFLNSARVIGFPTVYYSFAQAAEKEDGRSSLTSMMDNIIYQFAHFDSTLANSFKSAIQAGDAFGSPDDFYSRFQLLLRSLLSLDFAGHARMSPVLLLIDNFELPSATTSSSEYHQFLQLLHAATKARHQISPPTSPVVSNSDPAPAISGPNSKSAQFFNSLPLPSFLRIVIMSRSLGNQPALIEKVALIRDYRQFMANGKEKGNQRAKAPLTPIAEIHSQSSTEA